MACAYDSVGILCRYVPDLAFKPVIKIGGGGKPDKIWNVVK